jgi:hypothetical protein
MAVAQEINRTLGWSGINKNFSLPWLMGHQSAGRSQQTLPFLDQIAECINYEVESTPEQEFTARSH